VQSLKLVLKSLFIFNLRPILESLKNCIFIITFYWERVKIGGYLKMDISEWTYRNRYVHSDMSIFSYKKWTYWKWTCLNQIWLYNKVPKIVYYLICQYSCVQIDVSIQICPFRYVHSEMSIQICP
jgi:hypothetical protein